MLEHKQTTLHRASIVSKRDDCLTNAAECTRLARSSRNELEKRTWQQMSVSWTRMAKAEEQKAERKNQPGVVPGETELGAIGSVPKLSASSAARHGSAGSGRPVEAWSSMWTASFSRIRGAAPQDGRGLVIRFIECGESFGIETVVRAQELQNLRHGRACIGRCQ